MRLATLGAPKSTHVCDHSKVRSWALLFFSCLLNTNFDFFLIRPNHPNNSKDHVKDHITLVFRPHISDLNFLIPSDLFVFCAKRHGVKKSIYGHG